MNFLYWRCIEIDNLSEEKIELMAERSIDKLDNHYLKGYYSEDEYKKALKEIDKACKMLYSRMKLNNANKALIEAKSEYERIIK